ncbi:MAG: hypothetical protein HWE27_03920 [Gammaproteobacteria bacterium]|nr:hypothetical protein [Gammaproteobacteria bacterium]
MKQSPLTSEEERQLKSTLQQHASQLDGDVPVDVAEDLQNKLAAQSSTLYSKRSSHPETHHSFKAKVFRLPYYAVAASLVIFTAFSVTQLLSPEAERLDNGITADSNSKFNSSAVEKNLNQTAQIDNVNSDNADKQPVLKSDRLHREYAAVLQDLTKIKNRIVSI